MVLGRKHVRCQPAGPVVMSHVRVKLKRDSELVPGIFISLLLEERCCQVGVVNSRCLVQLDGAIVIGDRSRESPIHILHRTEIVPRHRIFLLQLGRSLEVGTRRRRVTKFQMGHADLVQQHNLIASPTLQRVEVVIQRILRETSCPQHIPDRLQLFPSRCRRIGKM